jgi:hypothetical protein
MTPKQQLRMLEAAMRATKDARTIADLSRQITALRADIASVPLTRPHRATGKPKGRPPKLVEEAEPAPVESPAANEARTPTITEAERKETPDELRARLGLTTPEQEEAERTARLLMANKIPAMDDDEVLSPGAKRALLDIAGWTHTAAEPIDDGSPANPIRNPGGEQPEPQQPFDPKFDASGMRIMPDITPRWWRRK